MPFYWPTSYVAGMESKARALLEAIASKLSRNPEILDKAVKSVTSKASWSTIFRRGIIAQEVLVTIYALYLFVKTGQRDDSRILWAIAGLLYVLMPLDAIPDYIPVAGYLDDAFVVTSVASTLASVLSTFVDTARQDIDNMTDPWIQWIKEAGKKPIAGSTDAEADQPQEDDVFFDCEMDAMTSSMLIEKDGASVVPTTTPVVATVI